MTSEKEQTRTRSALAEDRSEVARMAMLLWPGDYSEELTEFERWLVEREPSTELGVIDRAEGGLRGFVWLAERRWAEGCPGGPVGYVEGWFVDADSRFQGVGRALIDHADKWCRSRGYEHLGSDADLDNLTSIAAHGALGFTEVGRSVHFARPVVSE